jgi:hypothetical protein
MLNRLSHVRKTLLVTESVMKSATKAKTIP